MKTLCILLISTSLTFAQGRRDIGNHRPTDESHRQPQSEQTTPSDRGGGRIPQHDVTAPPPSPSPPPSPPTPQPPEGCCPPGYPEPGNPHPPLIIVVPSPPLPPPEPIVVLENWRDNVDGEEVVLRDPGEAPDRSGFDFSEEEVCSHQSKLVDIYFSSSGGECTMRVLQDADIQDLGPTSRIEKIEELPGNAWAPTHDVKLTVGHSYLVWTWDDQFVEFRVAEMATKRVVFDWVYQVKKPRRLVDESLRNGGSRPEVKFVMFER